MNTLEIQQHEMQTDQVGPSKLTNRKAKKQFIFKNSYSYYFLLTIAICLVTYYSLKLGLVALTIIGLKKVLNFLYDIVNRDYNFSEKNSFTCDIDEDIWK